MHREHGSKRHALKIRIKLCWMFSYQIFVLAKSTPDVDFVLKDAKERMAAEEKLPNV